MTKVVITVPEPEDKRKKSWAKALTKVDLSKSNGYAFVGNWLRRGERAEVNVGSYILLYDQPGSMKNWYPYVRLMKAEQDGTLTEVLYYEGQIRERSWALAVRDKIANLLPTEEEQQKQEISNIDLSNVPTETLIEELRRRGLLGEDKEEIQ